MDPSTNIRRVVKSAKLHVSQKVERDPSVIMPVKKSVQPRIGDEMKLIWYPTFLAAASAGKFVTRKDAALSMFLAIKVP
jgi:hypothetical protein